MKHCRVLNSFKEYLFGATRRRRGLGLPKLTTKLYLVDKISKNSKRGASKWWAVGDKQFGGLGYRSSIVSVRWCFT